MKHSFFSITRNSVHVATGNMPLPPPAAPSPQPVFTKRAHPSKRRARKRQTGFSPPDDEEALDVQPLLRSASQPTKPVTTRRSRPLLAAPRVPGYEHDNSSDSLGPLKVDYSETGLARLREQNKEFARPSAPPAASKAPTERPARSTSPLEKQKSHSRAHVRPDPFSDAWQEGLTRAEDDQTKNVDGEVDVVLDDYTGLSDFVGPPAYLSLEVGNSEVCPIRPLTDAEEDGTDDGEWEKEVMRRAGQKLVSQESTNSEEREMSTIPEQKAQRIVQEAEESASMRQSSSQLESVTRCIDLVQESLGEWEARQKLAEEKIRKLHDAETKNKREARRVEHQADQQKSRLIFYDSFAAQVDDLSDILNEKREALKSWHAQRLDRLKREAQAVEAVLLGRPDEFGRSRPPSLLLPEYVEERLEKSDSPFADVDESVVSIENIKSLFEKWKREYPDDYEEAFGDSGLGNLAAAMALGRAEDGLSWMGSLPDRSLRAAATVSGVIDHIATALRAQWQPRQQSCGEEDTASLAFRVVRVLPDNSNEAEAIVRAFRDRAMTEMNACVILKDVEAAEKTAYGAITCAQRMRKDVGLLELLTAFEDVGATCVSGEMKDALQWVASSGDGIFHNDTAIIARKINSQEQFA